MTLKRFKKMAFSILGALMVLGLLYIAFVPKTIEVEIAEARTGVFVRTIESDAMIRAQDRYTVPAFAEGDLRRVDLKVGDQVHKGSVLAWLNWDIKDEPVRAPINGVVSRIYRESAGPIHRGEPILELVDPSRLEMMVELLTSDAAQVKVGNRFELVAWGGDEVLRGTVSRVSKAGYKKISALGVEEEKTEVIGTFDLQSRPLLKRLGDQYHADVKIELDSTDQSLMVPLGTLFRKEDQWAVYRVENHRAKERTVEVLARNSTDAHIEAGQPSGISNGDRLILFPGDRIRDGVRVGNDKKNDAKNETVK